MLLCPGLDTIKTRTFSGSLVPGMCPLAEGMFLHSDPRLSLSGTFHSPMDRVLELSCTISPQAETTLEGGTWCGLHMPLNLPSVAPFSHLGLLCRHAAPQNWTFQACLRSSDPDHGFRDCFFPKHMLMDDRPRTDVDALYLDEYLDLPLEAEWRELILFLPCESFTLTLHSLHLFLE